MPANFRYVNNAEIYIRKKMDNDITLFIGLRKKFNYITSLFADQLQFVM